MFFIRGEIPYDVSIRTVFRGTVGPVAGRFKDDYFFGINKKITLREIHDSISYLLSNRLIEGKKGSNERYYYRPLNIEQAHARIEYMKKYYDELINQYD